MIIGRFTPLVGELFSGVNLPTAFHISLGSLRSTEKSSAIRPLFTHIDTMLIAKKEPDKGLIFSIQSYSVHDGPGTRTTIFMNDCPLRCKWCCNPEGLFSKPIMLHSNAKCKRCGECVKACPHHAITIDKEKGLVFDRKICNDCHTMECVEVCMHEGNSITGEYYTIEQLLHRLDRERPYWGDNGGVTFSGGEPLMQKNFMLPLLKACKERYIHVCVETTGCIPSDYWLQVLPYIDWVFIDIKQMDTEKHKSMTGVRNELILKNIELLARKDDWEGIVVPRIPVIPGFNDDEENIEKTAAFVHDIGLEVINILPFHRLGESKYRQLGENYLFNDQESPTDEWMEHLKSIIERHQLFCYIGYNTPF